MTKSNKSKVCAEHKQMLTADEETSVCSCSQRFSVCYSCDDGLTVFVFTEQLVDLCCHSFWIVIKVLICEIGLF